MNTEVNNLLEELDSKYTEIEVLKQEITKLERDRIKWMDLVMLQKGYIYDFVNKLEDLGEFRYWSRWFQDYKIIEQIKRECNL